MALAELACINTATLTGGNKHMDDGWMHGRMRGVDGGHGVSRQWEWRNPMHEEPAGGASGYIKKKTPSEKSLQTNVLRKKVCKTTSLHFATVDQP